MSAPKDKIIKKVRRIDIKHLELANQVIRSAWQISKRELEKGCKHTNWDAFLKIVEEEAVREHAIIYPKAPRGKME